MFFFNFLNKILALSFLCQVRWAETFQHHPGGGVVGRRAADGGRLASPRPSAFKLLRRRQRSHFPIPHNDGIHATTAAAADAAATTSTNNQSEASVGYFAHQSIAAAPVTNVQSNASVGYFAHQSIAAAPVTNDQSNASVGYFTHQSNALAPGTNDQSEQVSGISTNQR